VSSLTLHQSEFETVGAAGLTGVLHYGYIFNSSTVPLTSGPSKHYEWGSRRAQIGRRRTPELKLAQQNSASTAQPQSDAHACRRVASVTPPFLKLTIAWAGQARAR
jgi:hypothetical protein